ncbi:unnamed protein product [Soboliphyme baturini]|uniref:DNA methyltransferase 1-associated protein 1 n=1 Tax=Soboliphyme baturini TaxID=241478 RepID=A0A183IQ41_9BILA|nr:unnamed protein product [Soboliphyme baturini]
MLSDVQHILEVPTAVSSSGLKDTKTSVELSDGKKVYGCLLQFSDTNGSFSQKIQKAPLNSRKRPEGMKRELFNLLINHKSDIPPLIPTSFAHKLGGYKNLKANLGSHQVRPWEWSPFTNPARQDNLVLHHWARVEDRGKKYLFSRFNRVLELPSYTLEEYNELLSSPDWTKSESDHLMELCRQFDIRWPVIFDRWNPELFSRVPTLNEMKERYYNICNALIKSRTPPGKESKLLCFDSDHEQRRRDQLEKLWARSKEEVEEERNLLEELKKIEARKKERERKANDLQKLISEADNPIQKQKTNGNPLVINKKRLLKVSNVVTGPADSVSHISCCLLIATYNTEPAGGLKFPDFKNPGIYLRSQKMRLPPTFGQKKAKMIEQALTVLALEHNPVATEEICEQFNKLRSDIVLLYELKCALAVCEYELETLRHQYSSITSQVRSPYSAAFTM